MAHSPIDSSRDFWNLDGLPPAPNLKGEGRVVTVPLSGRKRIGVLDMESGESRIVALLPRESTLLSIDPERPNQPTRLLEWDKKDDYVDMAARGRYLCLLGLKPRRIDWFRLYLEELRLLLSFEITPAALGEIEPAVFSQHSRIALALKADAKEPRPAALYVVSGAKSKLVTVLFAKDAPLAARAVEVASVPAQLGREVHVAHDPVSRSLIISDTEHHRIVEVDVETGAAEVIAGTGQPGDSRDGDSADAAPLNAPAGLALYRHAEVIDRGMLDPKAATILDIYDQTGRRPRAVLFVERGTSRVVKLLDLPTQVRSHGLPYYPTLYTLLGRPARGADSRRPDAADLRSMRLADPSAVAVSLRGDLLVGCADRLHFLRPLTSVGELRVQERGGAAGVEFES
jgi:hypothetical protein